MFIPNYFKNENKEEIERFLHENGFAILLSQDSGKITGTHIPLELDTDKNGKAVLLGHIAKENPQAKDLRDGEEILAIFNGPDSYVSSSWYRKENAPTWNYIAVHVYGKIRLIAGEELLDSLKKLVSKYEQASENPISVEKMSSRTLRQVEQIVGFSIEITDIQAAYKLSQNRDDTDYCTIVDKLEKNGSTNSAAIAEEMKKRRK